MYGPAGLQIHAGTFEQQSLREAAGYRRSHTDTDHLKEMEHAAHRAVTMRIVAAAATVLVALTIFFLI